MSTPIPGLRMAQERFERDYADLLSLIQGGLNEFYSRAAAEITLHPELSDEVNRLVMIHAKPESRPYMKPYTDLVDARYMLLCAIFVRLRDRDAFDFASGHTDESLAQMEKMEEVLGLREAAPPPPLPRSAQEILEDQVVMDFSTLPTNKFRQKLNNNAAYRETYNRLAETNRLASRATTLHDGRDFGKVGG